MCTAHLEFFLNEKLHLIYCGITTNLNISYKKGLYYFIIPLNIENSGNVS